MINDNDMKVVSMLRENARQSLIRISKKTGIPVSTIYDRMKNHEKSIIKKYVAILDFPKLGMNIRSHIHAYIKNEAEFESFINENLNINSAFKVSGKYNYMLDVICRHMSEYDSLMREIDRFKPDLIETHFVHGEIKNEEFLAGDGGW
jgi:DNA-binding Lrp family transcriptional regulator